jgi:hypothetical protein
MYRNQELDTSTALQGSELTRLEPMSKTAHQYAAKTEGMVKPGEVGSLFDRALKLSRLPRFIQNTIIQWGAKRNPDMGFVVEPYSFFLAYEITDLEAASALLPKDYELAPTSFFSKEKPRFCAIVGAFNIHTSVFWGNRIELYAIARNKRTGMLSWVIVDYDSNTISYDAAQGFTGPSTKKSVVTTLFTGELLVDYIAENSSNALQLSANLKQGEFTPLNPELWIEGNLSVDYGGHLLDEGSEPFSLLFDPGEMTEALKLELDSVHLAHNAYGDKWRASEPFSACCFPFAQHYITGNAPRSSKLRNAEDLRREVEKQL